MPLFSAKDRFSTGEWSRTTPITSPFLKIGAAVVSALLSKNSLKFSVVLTVPLNAAFTEDFSQLLQKAMW